MLEQKAGVFAGYRFSYNQIKTRKNSCITNRKQRTCHFSYLRVFVIDLKI